MIAPLMIMCHGGVMTGDGQMGVRSENSNAVRETPNDNGAKPNKKMSSANTRLPVA